MNQNANIALMISYFNSITLKFVAFLLSIYLYTQIHYIFYVTKEKFYFQKMHMCIYSTNFFHLYHLHFFIYLFLYIVDQIIRKSIKIVFLIPRTYYMLYNLFIVSLQRLSIVTFNTFMSYWLVNQVLYSSWQKVHFYISLSTFCVDACVRVCVNHYIFCILHSLLSFILFILMQIIY